MKELRIFCDRCKREVANDSDLHALRLAPKWIMSPTSSWEPGGLLDLEICNTCACELKKWLRP